MHLDKLSVIYFGCLVVAVILHEISHGVVALWFGDRTAKEAGRLTLNPVPHIDPFGSIILPAMGAKSGKELLLKLDRNGDNKVSRSEFLVITNWLFEFASSPTELALGDLERGPVTSAPAAKRYDPARVPSGMPGGRGGPWETNKL